MIPPKFIVLFALAGFSFAPLAVAGGSPQESQLEAARTGYAGDASCISCHRTISQSYQQTGHHLTSQLPTSNSVLGSFRPGANSLTIVNPAQSVQPGLQFLMEARKDGLFETARSGWAHNVFQRTERIDLVTGSGARGQTYLYWQGDRLFELPVSYWTDGHRWINSPGYINGTAEFSRVVNPACLECHASYIRALSSDPSTNRYDRANLIVGIACESCHGAGAKHVQLETKHETEPNQAAPHGILNPAKFSRDRKIDLCAECHNGIQREALAPTFSYVPGRPLSDYFKLLPSPDVEHPDVHGNQVGLLERSKCYRSSEKMNCTICHDVHTTEHSAASYSLKCLTCHQWQSCGMSGKMGHDKIANRCVDCHMPLEETNVIVSETEGQVVHARMRNHWIRIYPEVHLAEAPGTTASH
jgi:hypothetical protein